MSVLPSYISFAAGTVVDCTRKACHTYACTAVWEMICGYSGLHSPVSAGFYLGTKTDQVAERRHP